MRNRDSQEPTLPLVRLGLSCTIMAPRRYQNQPFRLCLDSREVGSEEMGYKLVGTTHTGRLRIRGRFAGSD